VKEIEAPRKGLVSAVIAGYDCASFIEPTLRSVLEQTHESMEVIFVDDGSTDGTRQVVERVAPSATYVRPPHGGVSAARNAGIEAARGQFVAILDHDDLWAPDKIERQVALLEEHPDLGLVFTRARVTGDPWHPPIIPPPGGDWEAVFRDGIAVRDPAETYAKLILHNFVPLSSILCRRTAVPTDGFRTHLRLAEDHDFLLRVSELRRFAYVEDPLTTYTIRPGRATERMADLRLEDLAVFGDNLQRNQWLLRMDPAGMRGRERSLLKEAAYWLLQEGRRAEARPLLWKAWKMTPMDLKLPAYLLASLGFSRRNGASPKRDDSGQRA
jgi:glycosyltransferase involved in cell wall biosynthesis